MKFYQKTWFMWLTLIFFAPVGIFVMWKYHRFNKPVRIVLSAVFGIVFMIVASSNDSSSSGADTSKKTTTEQTTQTAAVSNEDKAKKEAEDKAKKEAEEKAKAEQKAKELAAAPIEEIVTNVAKDKYKDRFVSVTWEDQSKGKLILTLKLADNLTNNMIKSGMLIDAKDVCEDLSNNEKFKALNQFTVVHVAEFTNVYGNTSTGNAGIISLSLEQLKKVNWDNFLTDNIPKIATSYFVHPSLNK